MLRRILPPVLASVVTSTAGLAQAAPPGEWALGVERIFGFSRVTNEVELPGGATQKFRTTNISLLADLEGGLAYSPARLSLDYLSGSSVTFGAAIGYGTQGDSDRDVWLLAPRLGYFGRPMRAIGLWPRVGLTHISVSDDNSPDESATALTLEVPVVILGEGTVGVTLTPHADIGFAGSTGEADRTITEIGLQFGLSFFF